MAMLVRNSHFIPLLTSPSSSPSLQMYWTNTDALCEQKVCELAYNRSATLVCELDDCWVYASGGGSVFL